MKSWSSSMRTIRSWGRTSPRDAGLALPHRSTYVLVFNSQGDLYVQKRTLTKDVFPGYFDVAAGGVVLAGETYVAGGRT